MSELVVIGNAKGGVGRTTIAVQAALAFARSGRQTALVDASFGLGCVDLHLGLSCVHDVQSVLTGRRSLAETMVEHDFGLSVLPGASGSLRLSAFAGPLPERFAELLVNLGEEHDVVVVDSAAGLHPSALAPLALADRLVLVVNPDPSSVLGAHLLARAAASLQPDVVLEVVANLVESDWSGHDLYRCLETALDEHARLSTRFLAAIPRDERVLDAVRLQSPLAPDADGDGAPRALARLERAIVGDRSVPPGKSNVVPLTVRGRPVLTALSMEDRP